MATTCSIPKHALMHLAAEHVRRLLRDHDRRRVRVATNHARHDRCVDHPKSIHPKHPPLWIHYTADGAGARGMVARVHDALDVLPDVSLPVGRGHEMRPSSHIAKRCLLGHLHRRANPLDYALAIFLRREVVMEDTRLGISSRTAERHLTLARRLQQATANRKSVVEWRAQAFIIEHRGQEVVLDIWRGKALPRAREGASLGDVRCERSATIFLKQFDILWLQCG